MKVFICHSTLDSEFVIQVAGLLKPNFEEVFYYEEYQRSDEGFQKTIDKAQSYCDYFLIFINASNELTKWQEYEILRALKKESTPNTCVVYLGNKPKNPIEGLGGFTGNPESEYYANPSSRQESYKIAYEIVNKCFRLPFKGKDDLPFNPNLFSYEKDIIDFFFQKSKEGDRIFTLSRTQPEEIEKYMREVKQTSKDADLLKKIELIRHRILEGCPANWPEVIHWSDDPPKQPKGQPAQRKKYPRLPKPLNEQQYGSHREPNAHVIAAALNQYHCEDLSNYTEDPPCMAQKRIFFPEAGPRKNIYFPRRGRNNLNISILVAGGIAPGINAVIDGIVQRHCLYAKENGYRERIYGIKNGLYAVDFDNGGVLIDGTKIALYPDPDHADASSFDTSNYAGMGGSIIGTSRVDDLVKSDQRDVLFDKLYNAFLGTDILYIIGGDGSMKLAHALWSHANINEMGIDQKRLSVVAIPKTMDNDILWMWQSFGFLSAVEKAREIIGQLDTEIKSNPRLCIIQLFGSDSGFVVSHAVAGTSSGQCDAALIPEVPFSLFKLSTYIKKRVSERSEKRNEKVPYGLIVMAETAVPTDAIAFVLENISKLDTLPTPTGREGLTPEEIGTLKEDINSLKRRMKLANKEKDLAKQINLSDEEIFEICKYHLMRKANQRIQGQTNDILRTAALKIVSRGLEVLLPVVPCANKIQPNWKKLRVMTNEPRHILRAIPPTTSDIIMGQRLGTLAVDNAMAGYTDFMISQWLTEFVLVPLKLVILGRKRIPQSGIFWKSVLAKTQQDPNLELQENVTNMKRKSKKKS